MLHGIANMVDGPIRTTEVTCLTRPLHGTPMKVRRVKYGQIARGLVIRVRMILLTLANKRVACKRLLGRLDCISIPSGQAVV
jgi:hypothetical protein